MNIAGYFQEIIIRVDQKSLISTLIQVSGTSVFAIERPGIADIEMTHEFRKIAFRRANQKMKVVRHQSVGT